MKGSLIQHIKQIFDALQINAEYSVYDTANDLLPDWVKSIKQTHEYIVCCNATFEKESLQEFIHKEILTADEHFYWFEGERVESEVQTNDTRIEQLRPAPCPQKNLKVKTRLPSWLDNYIFSSLNAEYSPDFQKFEYNLNLQYEENLKYLGTYFPRSYAETFCIFDNLFCNKALHSKYAQKTDVSVLSVGCGTGGDIIGLLTAINKHFSTIKKLNVVAVDGNEAALNILSQIIQQASRQFHKEVALTIKQVVFDSIISIDIDLSFDFIITSKMINEILNKGKGHLDNSYYDFVETYSPMLSEKGVMMILDVTTKVGVSEFCPILMNRQINQFVFDHPDFVSIIPIPCSGKKNCQTQCFSQKEFAVTHSKFTSDKSRVAYRILVKRALSQELQLWQLDTQYQIQPDRYCGQGSKIADGFFLPNETHIINENEDNEKSIEKAIEQSRL